MDTTSAVERRGPYTAEITNMSASRLLELMSNGELNASDVVDAHIARIEQVNPVLEAVVFTRFKAARAEAREADARRKAGVETGALEGLPITIKECLDLEGSPSTFGLMSRRGEIAVRDERHVARMRGAGAIVLGKTNVAQLLFYYESSNEVYGCTNNPWNLQRSPGGSSGGEAAVIASGGSPLGLGTDIGGSVRVPAHFCGIAGFKPTMGRTPDTGRYSIPVGQQAIPSQVGLLARHVEDLALGLGVISGGTTPGEAGALPPGDFRKVDTAHLKIAVVTNDGTFYPSPAVERAVREAALVLVEAGASVTPWRPPDAVRGVDLLYGIFSADRGALMREMIGKYKAMPAVGKSLGAAKLPRWMLSPIGGMMRWRGQTRTAESMRMFGHGDTRHYWKLVEALLDYRESFREELDRAAGGPFDVILTPPCALPAYTHGASKDLMLAGGYACLYNVLGYPAGVVPVTKVRKSEEDAPRDLRDRVERAAMRVDQGSAGLPVGVQVVARPWMDHVALAVMHLLQEKLRGRAEYPATPVQFAGVTERR